MELIIGIVHLIHLEHRLQASLVKGRVVSHQWQSLNLWLNLSPYLWKYPGVHGILHGKSMHPSIPIGIILRLWLDETVVAIHNLTIPYNHNAHGANAGSLLVGGLKVYCCKILHECKVNINLGQHKIKFTFIVECSVTYLSYGSSLLVRKNLICLMLH